MKHAFTSLFSRTVVFTVLLLFGTLGYSRADLDFNRDNKTDIAFQSQANASLIYWNLNGPNFLSGGSLPTPISPDWRLIDSADVNGDTMPDLIYQNSTTHQILYAYLNGSTTTGGTILSVVPVSGYQVVGVADVNGDGKPDLIFQNQSTGQIVFWIMNGTTYVSGSALSVVPGANYKVVGVGDFNGDGKADLVFQNTATNQIAFWFLNGTTFIGGSSLPYIPASGYSVAGLGDPNNDGKPDLILQNQSTGQLVYWLLSGTTFAGGDVMTSPFSSDWKATGIRTFTPRPVSIKLETLGLSALYGTVRLRVRNLNNTAATIGVRIGSAVSPAAFVGYAETSAPDNGIGGAVDFRVPTGMAAGTQNLILTVNGKDSPPLPVTISDTNPFAVFTVRNSTTLTQTKFVAELRADMAPNTVANFVNLATGTQAWQDPCNGNQVSHLPFYTGLTFHRVISGFVAQGGDPYTRCKAQTDPLVGQGGPGYTIPFEKTGLTHNDGALSMARGNSLNSAGSQFYICDGPQHQLDPTFDGMGNPISGYAVFGIVVENLANAKAITKTYQNTPGNPPIAGVVPDTMTDVTITGKIDGP